MTLFDTYSVDSKVCGIYYVFSLHYNGYQKLSMNLEDISTFQLHLQSLLSFSFRQSVQELLFFVNRQLIIANSIVIFYGAISKVYTKCMYNVPVYITMYNIVNCV